MVLGPARAVSSSTTQNIMDRRVAEVMCSDVSIKGFEIFSHLYSRT